MLNNFHCEINDVSLSVVEKVGKELQKLNKENRSVLCDIRYLYFNDYATILIFPRNHNSEIDVLNAINFSKFVLEEMSKEINIEDNDVLY